MQINKLLQTVVSQNASDLILTVAAKPMLRLNGRLVALQTKVLEPDDTVALMRSITSERCQQELQEVGSTDFGFSYGEQARFRVAVFKQRGYTGIVLRLIPNKLLSFSEIGLSDDIQRLLWRPRGLVLVTGPTGSGKTTTLATMIDYINMNRDTHIITVEDPIEYFHSHKRSVVTQRELGVDVPSFAEGLRRALRQNPDVILVGEMRDLETMETAISAAETGHLVLSTLHTVDAGQTINRILGMFETEEQEQVRARLADTLRWVISQRLVPKVGGGRYALLEIMGANLRTQETIRLGESEGKSFYEIIEASQPFGWHTFDFSALEAYEQNKISEDTALLYCTKRGPVARGIDNIKKTRGESTHTLHSLRMKAIQNAARSHAPPLPAALKLK